MFDSFDPEFNDDPTKVEFDSVFRESRSVSKQRGKLEQAKKVGWQQR